MSTFRPPSERRSTFNPVFYTSDSETGATLEDLDTKLNRINGTSSGQTLTNASFSGTVTGLNTGMIPTLDSKLLTLSAGSVNANFTTNYTKSYLNSWDPATISYLDFSNPAQLGQDVTGKGNDAIVNGPVAYVASATRTHAVKFPLAYVGSLTPSENTPCIQLDNQIQAVKTLSPSNWSVSMWVNVDPATSGTRPTIISVARADNTGLPVTYMQLNVQASGALSWRGRVENSGPNEVGMGTISLGTWAHLAIVFTSTTVTTYINGVQAGVCSLSTLIIDSLATKGINTLTFGATRLVTNVSTTFTSHLAFAGMMSDISVHARALTQPEIAKLAADDYGSSIFVLAGSDNMVGAPLAVAGIDDVHPTRAIQYDTISNQAGGTTVIQASNPLRHLGTVPVGSTGLWRTFVSDLHKYGNLAWRRKILVVPCGYAGSSFASEWAAGGAMSNATIAATNGALSRNSMNSVAALLWSAGEIDVANLRLTYAADLQAMLSLFQANIAGFSATATPIIMAEVSQLALGDYVVGTKRMIQQIREDLATLIASRGNMRVVKTSDLLCMQLPTTNWNIDSVRTLGSRYFDAFFQIKGYSRNQPVTILGPASTVSTSTGLPVPLLTKEILTPSDVGLGNVANTSDAAKPVSTAQQTALDLKAPLASPTFTGTVSGITKDMVGLGDVANTSDAAKPISDLTQAALNIKASVSYVDTKLANLVNSAPATLDTLAELGAALGNDPNFATSVSTLIGQKAPLANPSFTGTVSGISKAMVGLGNVSNTSDAEKPISDLTQTALNQRMLANNGKTQGFLGFRNIGAGWNAAFPYYGGGAEGCFGSMCSNLTGGNGDLSFINNSGFTNSNDKTFTFYKYTSATDKVLQASISYGGAFNVPGTITGPTITALEGRVLLLEDGVSLLGARVGSLEASGSGSPTFQKLTSGSTTVETNATLKNVYFLTANVSSNTTLTFPDLEPGDSKYSGFSIKVRVRSGSASQTLTLTCPASPSAFVPMGAGRYNSRVFNTTDGYIEFITSDGDYVELVRI